MSTKILNFGPWTYYLNFTNNKVPHFTDKVGKWMYFFDDKQKAMKLCKEAVQNNIVLEAKHSNAPTGVACFYLNGDDIKNHKKVIQFFLDNDMIRKTKSGRLYNISFKFDKQTDAHLYGKDFKGTIKLDQFIDLNTGEFL